MHVFIFSLLFLSLPLSLRILNQSLVPVCFLLHPFTSSDSYQCFFVHYDHDKKLDACDIFQVVNIDKNSRLLALLNCQRGGLVLLR